MKKKICFIVSTPYTAKAFLESHFESLSKQYEVYLVANLNDLALPNYSNQYLQEIKHIPIHRKINLIEDLKALFLLTKYLRKNKFDVDLFDTNLQENPNGIESILLKNKPNFSKNCL